MMPRRRAGVGRNRFAKGKRPKVVVKWQDGASMNKTEDEYARTMLEPALLAGEIIWYAFEPFKLRLGPSNFYSPDFGVVREDRSVQIHEVKAVWGSEPDKARIGFQEDARQKLRDAAQQYPFFNFLVAARRGDKLMRAMTTTNRWQYEHIEPFNQRPPPR
ncbi:MAG: hypothetical protein WBG86_15965 [Polyangiales bacterium]